MEIRNWKTDEVIYRAKSNDIKELVEKAVKEGISLSYANLRHAILYDVDLHCADLRHADLSHTDLSDANLRGAVLSSADISSAYISDADLSGAILSGAILSGAILSSADLSGAILCDAVLRYAILRYADLSHADLDGAILRNADLQFAKNVPDNLPMACPKEGSFVGWKKVKNKLVKLEIPEDAKRSSATSKKCRCSKAKVLAITDLDGTNPIDEVINFNYCATTYRVGEMVYPDSFNDDRWNECSNGIHFFMDKHSAIDY